MAEVSCVDVADRQTDTERHTDAMTTRPYAERGRVAADETREQLIDEHIEGAEVSCVDVADRQTDRQTDTERHTDAMTTRPYAEPRAGCCR